MSLSYFWGFELALGVATALVVAGWMIVRQNRANVAYSNLQRLIALDAQAFQDDLNTIRDDIACIADAAYCAKGLATSDVDRIANTADSAKKSVASIGNAMLEAIKKIETRLDMLQSRIDELRDDDRRRNRNAESSEMGRLQARIDRISKNQKLIEDRLSDEIRFNLERAKIVDATLKEFANRVSAVSEHLNGLLQDYDELTASVEPLKQAGLALSATSPQAHRDNVNSKARLRPTESSSRPQIPLADETISDSNIGSGSEPIQEGGGRPSDQAA